VNVVWTILGLALIAVALRDIFETLFHPSGRGVLGRSIAGGVWSASRRLVGRADSARLLAGPLGYIAVLASWTTMLVVGWALVFLPHLPEGFTYNLALTPSEHDSFFDALYLSLVNLTSLGYGDIVPEATGLRILGPVETLFGLGLLTASISWLISIHATLSRRDALAH
jgi:Ion channel